MHIVATPVAGERSSQLEQLRYHHTAFLAVAHGLTDEQARSAPTVSALSIGGLIKHITVVQYAWTQQVSVEPDLLNDDPWSLVGMMSHRQEQHMMHEDDSLAGLLAAFSIQNAETVRVFSEADLDAAMTVPDHIRNICVDPHWTARWALMNINEEMARHAGHADIIRETIDGATLLDLLAAVEASQVQSPPPPPQPPPQLPLQPLPLQP